MTGRADILVGDCLSVLATLPADSHHCVVTSPPYWGLRSYLPGDHGDKALEIGSEPSPDAYVAKMLACAGKLPAEARPAHEAAIQTARDLLEAKADADDAALKGPAEADARVALEATCKQMSDALAERAVCN